MTASASKLMSSRWFPAVLALLAFTCDDAGDAPDDIGSACLRQAECETADAAADTAYDERACRDRLSAEYDDASSYGCSAAYAGWVSCQATQRGNCPPPIVIEDSAGESAGSASADDSVDPCQEPYDAFRRCQGKARRDECVVIGSGGAGGCLISCALFSGQCSAPARAGESSSCSCQDGEKAGGNFMGQCGEDSLEASARGACQ